jgi:UDP-N-acetylenolpyruvoylglucosamine reductase
MTIQNNVPLSEILWYKIGGKTKYLLTCENRDDISEAIDFIKKEHVQRVFICGLGSNLIFSDDYFDGVVIRIVAKIDRHSGLSRISSSEQNERDAGLGQHDGKKSLF